MVVLNDIDVLPYLKIANMTRKTIETLYCARNDDQFCGASIVSIASIVSFFNSMYGNRVVSETCICATIFGAHINI